MKFVCLGFIEESKYMALSEAEGQQMMQECFAYDDELRRGGHFLGGEALQSTQNAVTLRFEDGMVKVTDGPYVETKEMLGGILLLEARNLSHAIDLMSKHPGVRVGPFEIRPADEETNNKIAERDEVSKRVRNNSVSISHRIGIRTTITQVYEALSTAAGIASWWTRDVHGEANVDSAFEVQFLSLDGAELGSMRIRVLDLQAGQFVRWYFETGPKEWIGTDVQFVLKQEGDYAIVLFSHNGWREASEFTAHCSLKWATFLLSLKNQLENGRGLPSPQDLKIDNWN